MRSFAFACVSLMVLAAVRAQGQPFAPTDAPLAERFASPPAESRILPMTHFIPDAPEAQDALLRGLLDKGFGGMATNVSFGNYLESDEKFVAFKRAVDEAKQAGMSLWLYDERGYPSGNAGGITMRDHPEWEAEGRLFVDAVTEGGPVSLAVPPGTLVRATAFRVQDGVLKLDDATDLSGFVKDGTLIWEAPQGSWRVMIITQSKLYEGTHAAVSLADKLPYINLLMPEPTARFIEVTHGAYARHLGDDLGQYFVSTFTDEPSLMSMFMRPQPWRPIPWSPNLPVEFEKRRGYALEPVLPALAAEAGPKGQAARYDFWLTVGELVAENFFGQIQDWCRQHNVPSGGHLLYEEDMLKHVPLYGDFFRCARRLDAPGIDCLTSIPEEVPWHIARLMGSVADLEGRTVTMCETSDHSQRYRPEGDTRPVRQVTEDEIRGTINRLLMNGINTITSYYSFDGLSTEQLVRLNQWTGRCCTMLKGGHQVSDVAVLYPIESAWAHFTPARQNVTDAPADARRVEHAFKAASTDLYTSGRDFTYIDSKALVDAKVEKGVLKLNGLEWRVVVLPAADTLPMEAWQRLADFWRSGGVVIALTSRPANSEKEFPSPAVTALADEVFGTTPNAFHASAAGGCGVFLPRGSEALLPHVLDALIERDVRVSGGTGPIRATHRVIDGNHIYFVINDGRAPWEGNLTFAAGGKGEQWDPATGAQSPVDPSQPVPVKLGAFGGMLYRFDATQPAVRKDLSQSGLGAVQWKPLPEVQPVVEAGEFVRGTLTPKEGDKPGWDAKAILSKSGVDTFMFAAFYYPQAVDLSQAGFVGFTGEIPRAQKLTVPLLVILQDSKGFQAIAETEQTMSEAGACQNLVSLSRLQPAGWNKDPGGTLDLSSIACIRIGWGGYKGTENEEAAFSLSMPQTGLIAPKI